jgi:hypothetical protein
MSPSPHVPYYVELFVPNAESEQEFLLFAVYAALIKYRASHHQDTSPPQAICNDAIALRQSIGCDLPPLNGSSSYGRGGLKGGPSAASPSHRRTDHHQASGLPDDTHVNHELVKDGWCWSYQVYAPGNRE